MLSIAMICALASGCGSGGRQDESRETAAFADLPRLTQRGVEYPYIRYLESSGQTASRGQAVFLYPIRKSRTELLALEYAPGVNVEDLFGSELFGRSGQVLRDGQKIWIEFLPISIPAIPTAGQEWRMRYARREFTCTSHRDAVGSQNQRIGVICISAPYTLKLTYDSYRGVIEFQDFCDYSICTFKLQDSHGLLSGEMLKYIRL